MLFGSMNEELQDLYKSTKRKIGVLKEITLQQCSVKTKIASSQELFEAMIETRQSLANTANMVKSKREGIESSISDKKRKIVEFAEADKIILHQVSEWQKIESECASITESTDSKAIEIEEIKRKVMSAEIKNEIIALDERESIISREVTAR